MHEVLLSARGRAAVRRLPPGLQRVRLVLGAPPSPTQVAWLAAHLAGLPPPLRLDVTTVGAAMDLTGLERALERGLEPSRPTGPLDAELDALERAGGALPVVVGPVGVDWALRRARGAVLVVPERLDPSPTTWPHVEVVARDAREVQALAPWAALLPPGASVTVRASPDVAADNPARSLRDAATLERAVRGAYEQLGALGLLPRVAGPLDDVVDPAATLVVRVARRGLLRRWWAGRDARALRRERRPLLLVP